VINIVSLALIRCLDGAEPGKHRLPCFGEDGRFAIDATSRFAALWRRSGIHPEPTFGAGNYGRLGEGARRAPHDAACLLLGLQAGWHISEMPLPRIQPIAPTWRKESFDDPEWVFEMKYDGYRALCYIEQRRNRLISRNNNIMNRFDALADQVATALGVVDAVLDGEIIAAEETGRPHFYDLLRGTRAPAYVAFDQRCRSADSVARRAPAGPAGHAAKTVDGRFRSGVRHRPRAASSSN
jgi:hypothetical protein